MYFFELKELIETNLKMNMPRDRWFEIEEMFSEIYLIEEDGNELICLKPQPNGSGDGNTEISLMFYILNGAFYDIGQWSHIKKIGEPVNLNAL